MEKFALEKKKKKSFHMHLLLVTLLNTKRLS